MMIVEKERKKSRKTPTEAKMFVRVGEIKDPLQAISKLKDVGVDVDHDADGIIIRRYFPSETKREIEIVVKTAAELGLPNDTSIKDAVVAARALGLKLGTGEVAVRIRSKFTEQPGKSCFLMVVGNREGELEDGMTVLLIGRDENGRYLRGVLYNQGCTGFTKFIFVR